MNKKQAEELTNDVLIADALVRLKTLETLLISKGIFSEEEFKSQMATTTQFIMDSILNKVNEKYLKSQ